MNLVTIEKENLLYPDNSKTEIVRLKQDVVEILRENNMKIATAESCTGGMLSQTITSVSGASNIFELGIVSYSNGIKTKMLEIPEDYILEHGVVSSEVAYLMAENVAKKALADIGVGITGVAGPGPDGGIPEGVIFIGIYFKNCRYVAKLDSGTENRREYNRELAVFNALNLVKIILGKGGAY
ncbi:MAG: CinA family protein [Oscillospiraceae bacterium]|nr:CinA family protein [Oscillospiraceae bacterium]